MNLTIWHIMKKEVIQTFRDRRMVAIIFLAPVLQTIIFGYAVNLDLKAQPTIIADLDRSATSRDLVQAIANHDGFAVVGYASTHDEAEAELLAGNAALALLIPQGFADAMSRNHAEVLVVMDGSDSNTALRAGQEAVQILNHRVLAVQQARVGEALAAQNIALEGLLPQLRLDSRAWFNPQLATALFFVPGVLALVLMVVTMLLTAMGLTREKEVGTLEQIMVTPVRPIELMLGKTLPFALMGLAEVAFIVSVANLVFDVPVRGGLLPVLASASLFLMTTLGLGLFVSTIAATQQQAMLTAFFILLPALMLSGYVYPIENMPAPVQVLTVVNPLRYFIELNRGIMIKGAALVDLWPSALKLALLGAAVLWGAAGRFHKRIS